jgi:hypothetical protein
VPKSVVFVNAPSGRKCPTNPSLRNLRERTIKQGDGIEKDETMVGFKTISLLVFALLLVAGCVPSTKQTQCAGNEAFNPTLRTCVPVVQTPSSFINISTTIPTSSISRYKNDTTLMSFRINISNPYNQAYTTRWTDSYNGLVTNYTGSVSGPLNWDVFPVFFQTQVGLHLLTVEVLDSTLKVVDSHSFSFSINDLPRPVFDTTGWLPASATPTILTTAGVTDFQSKVKNNGTLIPNATDFYTEWVLSRNGMVLTTERDNLTTTSVNGVSTHLFSFSSITNTPGDYVIRARLVVNATSEVLDERQWFTTLAYPASSKVTSAPLISNQIYTGLVTAYSGVDYTQIPSYNFTVDSAPPGSNRAQFCVTVADGRGSVITPEDSKFVKVAFYLNGSGPAIYVGTTTGSQNRVCLTDVGNSALTSIIFNSAIDQTITARVTDEASNREYTAQDLDSSVGSVYPISWTVRVKPKNVAPEISFGSTDTVISCPVVTPLEKNSCSITSDTNFNVGVNLVSDDFYNTASLISNLTYTFRLYRDTTLVTQCTGSPAFGAPINCPLSIPSFSTLGPLNLTGVPYSIVATVRDNGSPIVGTPLTSLEHTWNIPVVTETNTAPSITAFSTNATTGTPVAEKNPITFSLTVADAQMDNLSYTIQYCKQDSTADPTCIDVGNFISNTFARTNNAATVTINESSTLSEDFLLNLTGLGCQNTVRGGFCDVRFKAIVSDVPNTASALPSAPQIITARIINFNVAPTFSDAQALPTLSSTYQAFVGFPLTFSGVTTGFITDLSIPLTEKVTKYQWYAKTAAMLISDYRAIDGATGQNLTWTPSLIRDYGTMNPVSIRLCVSDEPSVTTPATICSNPWTVTVRNNVVQVHDMTVSPFSTSLALTNTDAGSETATFFTTPKTLGVTASAVYTAFVGNDKKIYVKRSLLQNNGSIVPDANDQVVSFEAFPDPNDLTGQSMGIPAHAVKDLTLAGDDADLYVSYRASSTNPSMQTTFYPQVRRIRLGNLKIAPLAHSSLFGFQYNGYTITASCAPSSDCVVTNPQDGTTPTIRFQPITSITGSITFTSTMGSRQINFASVGTPGTICSTCSGAVMAAGLAGIINSDFSKELMGIGAIQAGDTVSISGSRARDRLDLTGSSQPADQMGQIYINGSSWYLPYIDGARGGRISMISGSINAVIGPSNPTVTTNSAVYNSIDPASIFSTYFDGSNLFIAISKKSGSGGKLYKIDSSSTVTSTDLFGGQALLDIQVAANGNNVFVTAKTNSFPSVTKIGIYSPTLVQRDVITVDGVDTAVDSPTQARFEQGQVSSMKLVPYINGARIVASSLNGGSDHKLYMARVFTYNNSDWFMSCDDCNPIGSQDSVVAGQVKVSVAPVRFKTINSDYRLAQDGVVASEGIKDILMTTYGQLNTGGTAANPTLGVFNIQAEQIGARTLFSSGNSGALDAGLYRSPFVKD